MSGVVRRILRQSAQANSNQLPTLSGARPAGVYGNLPAVPGVKLAPDDLTGGAESLRTTVLVVDDEPAFHETIARHLTSYRRISAYSCVQARRMIKQHHVDVVLLDLSLPDGTGLQLLKEWRAERDDFEVVVITSHAELANAVECYAILIMIGDGRRRSLRPAFGECHGFDPVGADPDGCIQSGCLERGYVAQF
jgi:CheY-like chemotaxis protein